MGNQVVVSFLTDRWSDIEKQPEEFVRAISTGMNHGTDRLIDIARWGEESPKLRAYREEENRWARMNYVTVHQFQHADTPQITYTQYNSSTDVWDLAYALEIGLLQTRSPFVHTPAYEATARRIIDELRRAANRLERSLDKAVKERDAQERPE